MHLERLWLTDFRNYEHAELAPAPSGLTVVTGPNGAGKTNLLEAISYLATLRSFRGVPSETLVRSGAPFAVARAQGVRDQRRLLIEAQVMPTGRDRVQVNRQPLRRTRDLLGALQVTVFAPDDLELVKAGPGLRRQYLDDLLVALHPRHDVTQSEVDRVLKQRNALLKSAAGRSTPPADVLSTLEVWDAKLASAGTDLVRARSGLAEALSPLASDAYGQLADSSAPRGRTSVRLAYQPSWQGSLADALAAARTDDLRRGVSTVGPHRDELLCLIGDDPELPARTHASQGEQRSLAFSLRVAGHRLVTDRIGTPPILLLDDVFSELDPERGAALVGSLPIGQAILTTAGVVPAGAQASVSARVDGGRLLEVAA